MNEIRVRVPSRLRREPENKDNQDVSNDMCVRADGGEPVTMTQPLVALRSIFVPVDFSPASEAAIAHASLVGSAFDSQLTLFHAAGVGANDLLRWVDDEPAVGARMRAAARAELERCAAMLARPPTLILESEQPVVPPLVDIAVIRQIVRLKPDLVVMATHGRSDLGTYFLGSVCEEVLRASRTPVLAVPARARHAATYKRLVVPTDLSWPSRAAFPLACSLARKFDAELVLLHVARDSSRSEPDPHNLSGEGGMETALRRLLEDYDGVRVTPRIERGVAWDRIVAVANELEADAIIMATRGEDSFGDRVLGSQTERVIRRAGCGVFAVPVLH